MAAALELEGKIAQKQPVQSGTSARGGWSKQEFVVEYMDGNFPSSAAFTAWGDERVKDLSRFQVGDAVKVSFAIKGREYNGRWYNDLQIWKIAPAGDAQPVAPAPVRPAPQAQAPAYAPQAPAPTIEDMPADPEGEEDLPF